MKAETLRVWLGELARQTVDDSLASACDQLLGALTRKQNTLLDATVYRSCPECGGSRLARTDANWRRSDDDPGTMGVCPACADAPTAIVSAALREKAIVAAQTATGINVPTHLFQDFPPRATMGVEMQPDEAGRIVDAVLSTVLGHVRYAKEVGVLSIEHVGDGHPIAMLIDNGGKTLGTARTGDPIAILEEAGKEE